MRAYLAILKDSFREAIASRVLLIALSGIVVVLLLLAPFSLQYEQSTQLRRSEITNPERLLTQLQNGAQEDATPTAHLWSLLTAEQRESVERLLNPDPDQPVSDRRGPRGNAQEREIVNLLNTVITLDGLHDAASWADARLPEEALELQAKPSLSDPERKRLNLLLVAAAFPRSIQITDSQAISILYGTASIIDSIPLTPSQFEPIFQRILVAVITIFLGFFGIFASLLVTAGMIPRTFEPGEISLLLSKPVNRPLLFLTKFLGGCTFTLLYASVLVTGMWLLLGIRMNFWRSELLWCIPVYVFLFMIYFSISAVAGAIWRNSIVALSFVVIFWVGITIIGTAKQGIEDNIVSSRGIKEIVVGDGHILSVDGKQNTWVWNSAAERWNEVFQVPAGQGMGRFAQRFLASSVRFAPVFDSAGGRILALQQNQTRFGSLGPPELVAGFADDDWERVSLGRLPDSATTILVNSDGNVIVPTLTSICESTESADSGGLGNLLGNLTGGLIGGRSKAFQQLHSKDYPAFGNNFACSLNPADDSLLFYDGGVLTLMTEMKDGKYSIAATRDLETDSTGVLAVSGKHAILGLADGRILIVDALNLKTVRQTKLGESVLPRVCAAAKDGSTLAVLTHAKTILLFAGADAEPLMWKPAESGSCSAVAFSDDGRLLVSDGRLAVREYDLQTKQQTNAWAESPSFIYSLYDMVINPLWTLLPKPSQLDQFVPYVMTGDATVLVNEAQGPPGMIDRESLQQERKVFDARQAVIDNAVFVMIVLGIGCLIISRRDF